MIHELKISPEYFDAVERGVKTFEIRQNDRNFQVDDLLLLKEFRNEEFTGREVLRQVIYLTDYAQKENYVVMGMKPVPISFRNYLDMSPKEKAVFQTVITHANLYGFGGRDTTNTFWEIIDELIDKRRFSEEDQEWYREYWNRTEEEV